MKEAVAEVSRANDVKIQIKEGVTILEDLHNSVQLKGYISQCLESACLSLQFCGLCTKCMILLTNVLISCGHFIGPKYLHKKNADSACM